VEQVINLFVNTSDREFSNIQYKVSEKSYRRGSQIFQKPRSYLQILAARRVTWNNCTLCPHCIYVFWIYLRTNSDLYHLHYKLIGFYNRDEKCLQRGTDWTFKIKPSALRLSKVLLLSFHHHPYPLTLRNMQNMETHWIFLHITQRQSIRRMMKWEQESLWKTKRRLLYLNDSGYRMINRQWILFY